VRFFLLSLALVLFFSGCGYKPSSYYAKKTIGDSVYAFVEVLGSDPENAVYIKDAINEAVITKFHSKLASAQDAKTKMHIRISSIALNPVQYDKNGYVTLYRMTVALSTTITKNNGQTFNNMISNGSYDFTVEPNTTLSDEKRFNAIKQSAAKAIDMLISQISVKGTLNDDRSSNK
jgi:outer membrane lipopolysaccharide assembly protein LptE/RlpB